VRDFNFSMDNSTFMFYAPAESFFEGQGFFAEIK
jgi:hypothetical protein